MAIDSAIVLAGLVILMASAELCLVAGLSLGLMLRVSPLLIGMFMGVATSLPEIAVTANSAFDGQTKLLVSAIVGSNIVNMLLILALGVLLVGIPSGSDAVGRRSTVLLIASAASLTVAMISNVLGFWVGLIFFLMGCFYLVWQTWSPVNPEAGHEQLDQPKWWRVITQWCTDLFGDWFRWVLALGLCVLGLTLVQWGANLLVNGAVSLSVSLGLDPGVVGVTVVAIGTSLPELAVMLAALRQGQLAVTSALMFSSNIFNTWLCIGLGAMITPLVGGDQGLNLSVMIGATIWAAIVGWGFPGLAGARGRWMGLLGLALFAIYMTWTVQRIGS